MPSKWDTASVTPAPEPAERPLPTHGGAYITNPETGEHEPVPEKDS